MQWEQLLWGHLLEWSMLPPTLFLFWNIVCNLDFHWLWSPFCYHDFSNVKISAFTYHLLQISTKNNSLVLSNVCFHGKVPGAVPMTEKDVNNVRMGVYVSNSFDSHSLHQQLQFLVHHGQIGTVYSLRWSKLLVFTLFDNSHICLTYSMSYPSHLFDT